MLEVSPAGRQILIIVEARELDVHRANHLRERGRVPVAPIFPAKIGIRTRLPARDPTSLCLGVQN
jgi:hypothetical protein